MKGLGVVKKVAFTPLAANSFAMSTVGIRWLWAMKRKKNMWSWRLSLAISVRNYEKFVGHEHEHVCEVVHKIFLCMVLNATRINDEWLSFLVPTRVLGQSYPQTCLSHGDHNVLDTTSNACQANARGSTMKPVGLTQRGWCIRAFIVDVPNFNIWHIWYTKHQKRSFLRCVKYAKLLQHAAV